MRIQPFGSWFPTTKNWKSTISGKDWQKSIFSLCQTQSWQMSREWKVISLFIWLAIFLGDIGPATIRTLFYTWRACEIEIKNCRRRGFWWTLPWKKAWTSHWTISELKLNQAILSNKRRAVGGCSNRTWDWRGNGFNFRHRSTENIVWTLDISYV